MPGRMTLNFWPQNDKNARGYLQKSWVGMYGTFPETRTLFQTKICDFPYHISDLIKNLIPYSGARRVTEARDKLLWHVHGSWRKH